MGELLYLLSSLRSSHSFSPPSGLISSSCLLTFCPPSCFPSPSLNYQVLSTPSALLTPSLLHQISAKKTHYLATLKLIPQWVSLLLLKSGLANLLSPVFRLSGTSAMELVSSLTSNKDLHVIFSYLFYGEKKLRAATVSHSRGGDLCS